MLADREIPAPPVRRKADLHGFILISVAPFCATYVLSQGARWDWFEAPHIAWLTAIGASVLALFLVQQIASKGTGLLDRSLFLSQDFASAFIVSFVAGAALFGSGLLILGFAASVLGFTPTEAGLLLLPSSAVFVAALLLAALIMQYRRVPPIATVPFGILAIMLAMWMLSRTNGQSGAGDMMPAILVRGLGLGCLVLRRGRACRDCRQDRSRASGKDVRAAPSAAKCLS